MASTIDDRYVGKMLRGVGCKTGELRVGEYVRTDPEGVVIKDRAGKLGRIRDVFLDERACKGCGLVPVPIHPDGRITCSADCEALRVRDEWQKRELQRKTEYERKDRIYRGTR